VPYIAPIRRRTIWKEDKNYPVCEVGAIHNVGELNFAITKLILDYVKFDGVSYKSINEVIGVLQCVQLEFYRRLAVPYEECKRVEHGDVYIG